MKPDLLERMDAAKTRARIYLDTLKKCSCNQERTEFAESLQGPQENTDLIIQKALDRADQIQSKWIDKIRALSIQCRDMGEFKDRLIGLYGEMDTEEMASIMAQSTFLGNVTGRAEVQDEINV